MKKSLRLPLHLVFDHQVAPWRLCRRGQGRQYDLGTGGVSRAAEVGET